MIDLSHFHLHKALQYANTINLHNLRCMEIHLQRLHGQHLESYQLFQSQTFPLWARASCFTCPSTCQTCLTFLIPLHHDVLRILRHLARCPISPLLLHLPFLLVYLQLLLSDPRHVRHRSKHFICWNGWITTLIFIGQRGPKGIGNKATHLLCSFNITQQCINNKTLLLHVAV